MPINKDELLSEKLSQKLQKLIFDGVICPRQKLTSQRQLADENKVSVKTVREAIQALELKGMVETYRNGQTVCRNLIEPHVDFPQEQIDDSLEFQIQIMEFRAVLEGEAAYYAALRASDDQLEKLHLEYAAMQARNDGQTPLAKAKTDLNIHMMIAQASHNLLVISFSQIFYERYLNVFYDVLAKILKKPKYSPERFGAQYKQLCEALLNRDALSAKTSAVEHINYARSLLEEG